MAELRIQEGRIDQGAGQLLVDELLAELTRIYNERGPSPPDPAQLAGPQGTFVIGWLAEEPAACGGFRQIDPLTAELKRMYVRPALRGRGLSRLILRHLEREAAARGYRRMRLETGDRQGQALGLYRSADYMPIPRYSPYEDHPASICLEKQLLAMR